MMVWGELRSHARTPLRPMSLVTLVLVSLGLLALTILGA